MSLEPQFRVSSYCTSGSCVGVAFQTSSYCNGGACIEVAFETSSYCSGGNCVEVGFTKATASAGGNCVEVAGFRKSTSSNGTTQCVEVGGCACEEKLILVRDSKNKTGPVLRFAPEAWVSFLDGVKDQQFDL